MGKLIEVIWITCCIRKERCSFCNRLAVFHIVTSKERGLWLEGDLYRSQNKSSNLNQKCPYGVYSIKLRRLLEAEGAPVDSSNNNKKVKNTKIRRT